MNLKEIHYGIEIETVKRTREQIAWAIHSVVGGTVRHVGIPSSYDPWEVEDLRGGVWKVVGDASLTSVPAHLRAEVGEAETGESPVDFHPAEREIQGWISPAFRA
jgi:hypothetical protein